MSTSAEPAAALPADASKKFAFPPADNFLSYVILACGIFTACVGARQILTSWSLVPISDEWSSIDAITMAPHHQLPFSWLWSQHSEHRVVFYRLLLLADIHIFHGRHWIFFWAMLAVQLLSLACLAWLLRFCGLRGTLWRAILGLGAFALFCPTQWENFGWAFQISFLMPGFFLLLGLSALLRYQRSVEQLRPRWTYLALSVLAAGAATFSNANGILVWPCLLFAAIALLPRIWVLASYTGFAAVFIAMYLHHYVTPSVHSSPVDSLRHPLAMGRYIASYLGISNWLAIHYSLGFYSGLVVMLAAAIAAWCVLRRPKREPLQIALLSLLCFVAATAFLTALGRLKFGHPFESRYQTFNLLFWFATASLVLLLADSAKPRLRTLLLVSISVALLSALVVFPAQLSAARRRTQEAEAASAALLTGVRDNIDMQMDFPEPAILFRDADYIRRQQLFMFSDPTNRQMGQSFSSNFAGSPTQPCQGPAITVELVLPAELLGDQRPDVSALQISGSRLEKSSGMPKTRLVFVSNDKIVGYGVPMVPPFSGFYRELRKKDPGNWLGFAALPLDAHLIDIYAVDRDADAACHLAAVSVPRQ